MAEQIQPLDFSVDLLRALLWQYNKAENLQKLLERKSAWYELNQSEFWEDWLRDVFDLRTANQFGLVVWGILLGLKLYVNTAPQPEKPTLGFDNILYTNFDNGNFSNTHGATYMLPVATQRIALQLRYAQLTSSGTVPEINRILKFIFEDYGIAFLRDYGNMRQQYIFMFPLTADLKYLFDNYDILPRPAGVKSRYVDGTLDYFGFDPDHLNFDNGNFGS